MVRDNYKLGDSLNGVATYECGPTTGSEITKVKSTITINQVDSATKISYDELIRNNVGDDKIWQS